MAEQKEVGSKPEPEETGSSEEVLFDGTDWESEAEKIGKSQWFTPKTGTQTVRFLDDGTPDQRTYDDEVRDVHVFTVKVGGDELKWSVTKGSTESSLWGQLVRVASDRNGLEGEEITLIRTGTGNDTQYTVQETADL